MSIKKSLMVAGAVATIGVAGVTGLGVASAATDTSGSDSLIDKIATKFNVDKSEVKAVFAEERTERDAERQQKIEARLDALVAEGKITEDQKAKILAKAAELKATMESQHEEFEGKTKEEMRTLMQQRHDDLKKWAKENDIPVEYLKFVMVLKHHGHGMEMGAHKHIEFEKPANEL